MTSGEQQTPRLRKTDNDFWAQVDVIYQRFRMLIWIAGVLIAVIVIPDRVNRRIINLENDNTMLQHRQSKADSVVKNVIAELKVSNRLLGALVRMQCRRSRETLEAADVDCKAAEGMR